MMNRSCARLSLNRRKLLSQILHSDVEGACALAYVLDTCTEDEPCGSAACPSCGAAFQQAAVSVVERFVGEPSKLIRGRKSAITIVPPDGCVAPDGLTVEACQRVAATFRATLEKLNLPPIVMGLEVSFNEDTTGKVEPHWCIHGHGISLNWLSDVHVEGLQAEFPRSLQVKRPLYCVPLDNNVRGILYDHKAERVRRVTFLETGHPTRKPCRDTKRRPLRPWQAVSLAIVEHQLGFRWRLLTHGVDREAVRRHLAGLGWARDGP